MKIALIGLPQSGKKTLFTLLTSRQVPEGRKPGESIEGVAIIRDPRVDVLSEICQPESTVYAENNFVLCPDVVEGSDSRTWMDAVSKCDLVCLVVRAFQSEAVYHPAGSVDPSRDLENLRAELFLADMALAEKRLVRLEKEARSGQTPGQSKEEEVLKKCMEALENDQRLSDLELSEQELEPIKSLGFLTMIPLMVMNNVSEEELGSEMPAGILGVSCLVEQEIMDMESADDRREYMESFGLKLSGVDRVNAAAYEAQGLMSFYTIGKDEVRAWTIRKGADAPTAGGKIHSDIERGFIRAEVIKYDDLIEAGSEQGVKDAGKLISRGRDYILEDGDLCNFLFNV